jgi:hypothetical protein
VHLIPLYIHTTGAGAVGGTQAAGPGALQGVIRSLDMFAPSYTLPAVEGHIVTVAIAGIMQITSLSYLPLRLVLRDLAPLGLPARIHITTRILAGEARRDLVAVTERKRHGATIIPARYTTVIQDLIQSLSDPPLLQGNTNLVS